MNYNKMELPRELWQIIAYNLKFDIGLYKHCFLVNKLLCNIVKQIYNRIPKNMIVKSIFNENHNCQLAYQTTRARFELVDVDTLKIINDEYYKRSHYVGDYQNFPYKLSKNMLLLQKAVITFHKYGDGFKIILKIENFVDDNLQQKCHGICFQYSDDSHNELRMIYCEKIPKLIGRAKEQLPYD